MKDNANIVHVSPQIAQEMLDQDAKVRQKTKTKNRKLNARNVAFLAKEMEEDRWVLTGHALQWNDLGEMIDGQHRLNAVILSGKTVPFYVITGLSEKAHLSLDNGKRRTPRDVLHFMGVKYDGFMAASVTHILNWEAEKRFYHNRAGISANVIVEWIEQHPKIFDSGQLVVGSTATRQQGFKPGLLIALHWLFTRRNKGAGDYFITTLMDGRYDGETDNQIYQLRELIIKDALSDTRLDAETLAQYMLTAWNAWRKKVPIRSLRTLKQDNTEIL